MTQAWIEQDDQAYLIFICLSFTAYVFQMKKSSTISICRGFMLYIFIHYQWLSEHHKKKNITPRLKHSKARKQRSCTQ